MVQLRALEPNDLEFLYEIENDERFWYLGSVTSPYSYDVLQHYLENAHLDIYTTKQLRFVIQYQKLPVGAIDLYDFDPKNKRAGVGIIVLDEYQNKGIATNALIQLTEYAKNVLDMHQLYATIPLHNPSSLALFEKCGFITSGIKKDWLLHRGKWEDVLDVQLIF